MKRFYALRVHSPQLGVFRFPATGSFKTICPDCNMREFIRDGIFFNYSLASRITENVSGLHDRFGLFLSMKRGYKNYIHYFIDNEMSVTTEIRNIGQNMRIGELYG